MLRKYQGETLRPDSPCPSRPLPHDLVTGGILSFTDFGALSSESIGILVASNRNLD